MSDQRELYRKEMWAYQRCSCSMLLGASLSVASGLLLRETIIARFGGGPRGGRGDVEGEVIDPPTLESVSVVAHRRRAARAERAEERGMESEDKERIICERVELDWGLGRAQPKRGLDPPSSFALQMSSSSSYSPAKIALATTGVLTTAFVAYAAYFDYKRRNDPVFRKKLRKFSLPCR